MQLAQLSVDPIRDDSPGRQPNGFYLWGVRTLTKISNLFSLSFIRLGANRSKYRYLTD